MELIQKGVSDVPYTVIPNAALQDEKLSWQSRGLLMFLLSLPKDWIINKTSLHKFSEQNGRDATVNAFDELVNAGYVLKEPILGSNRGLCHYYVHNTQQINTKA